MTDATSYLRTITPSQRAEFERIREVVLSVAPETQEKISYQMPTFTFKQKIVLHFGVFKNHMSIFPVSDAMVQAIPELKKFRTSKGTLQFNEDNKIPSDVIKKFVVFKVAHIQGTGK